jgi:hypothetical protein
VLCDRASARAGEVRLDHLDVPAVVRREAVPVEEPLHVSEQEAVVGSEFLDARVNDVQALSQLGDGERRQTELAPPHLVIAVAWVVDGVDDDPRAERLEPRRDFVKPAEDRAGQLATEWVVLPAVIVTTSAGACARTRSASTPSVVLPSTREINQLKPELAREL